MSTFDLNSAPPLSSKAPIQLQPMPNMMIPGSEQETDHKNRVIVTDIDMTIGAMCRFMVKWSIAAIPAVIIIGFIWFVLLAILTALFH